MSCTTSPRLLGTLAVAAVLALLLAPAAAATEYTWAGALVDRAWDAEVAGMYLNWDPFLPLPGAGDTVIFSDDTAGVIGDVFLNGNRSVDTVRFENPTGAYTFKGPADVLSVTTIRQTAAAAAAANEIQTALEGSGGAGADELNLEVETGSLTLSGQVGTPGIPTVYNAMVGAGASLDVTNTDNLFPNYSAGAIQVAGTLTAHGANNSSLGDTDVTLQGGTLNLHGVLVPGAPSADLQLYWGFNEGAGATAGDGSVNGRTGTVNNAVWVGGQAGYGGALDFNGTNSQVNLNGDISFLNGLSELTVAMWIQSDATMQDRGFWEMRDSGNADEWGGRYDKDGGEGDTNVMKFGVTTTASGGNANRPADQYESAVGVQTTAWQHVAMTWQDGVGFKLYIDGLLDTATEPMPTTTGLTAMVNRFTVGDGTKAHWDGRIDEVYIYDRALDAGEINTVMAASGLFSMGAVSMAGTVAVLGDSTINVDASSATVGGLAPEGGSTLHVTGAGSLSSETTLFAGGAVALDTQVETRLGWFADDAVTPTTVTKTGAADLVFDYTAGAVDGDNTTLHVDEGGLVAAGEQWAAGPDPLGGMAVELNTGAEPLVFSSKFGDYAVASDITANDDTLIEFKTTATGAATGSTVTLNGDLDVAPGKTVSMVTGDGYAFVLGGATAGGGDLTLQSAQTAFISGTLDGLTTITLMSATPVTITNANALGTGNGVDVQADAFLKLDQAQVNLADPANPAVINLNPFGALGGDLTGARYNGAGNPQNVFLSGGSVLAHTAGPDPLRSDLPDGGATIDDLLYRGVTDLAGAYTFGDNGVDSIYRGGIIAPAWTPAGNFTGTLQEAAGAAGFEVGMRRDLTLENAIVRAATGNTVAFTGEARLDLFGNSFAADPGRADTFARVGTAPTETDPGTTNDYTLWLNQPSSIPAGMTWTVENGIVRQTDDGSRTAIANGATLNIGPHATYFTSQGLHGSGQINILDGGTVRYGGTGRLATMGWEDGATIFHNAGNALAWTAGESIPTNLALNVILNGTRTFSEGVYLGDGSRLGTGWNTNATYQGGTVKPATGMALDGTEQVIISAGPGHNLQVNDAVELAGVDIRTGDPDGTVTYLPRGDGNDTERVSQRGIRQTGYVEFNQRVRGDDLTMAGGNAIFNHADTNFTGDIDIAGGGVLYLGAGGPSNNQGNLTNRLISTTGLVADRVADRIIIGDNGRAELGIQFDAPVGASGRVEVTQPFIIDGDVRPGDKRSFWINRIGGSGSLNLDLMDVTLNQGGVFAVDENNINARAYLKVAGNSTVTQRDAINYVDIVRDASLPPYDGTNPVILNWGRVGDTAHNGDVRGTIGEGVQINFMSGRLTFPNGPGPVLNGSIHTETAPDGGDSYVRFYAGQDGVVAKRVTGTGEVVMGRSGVGGGTAEDIRGYVDEVPTGNPALLNVFAPTVRVVNDGDNNTDDASIESDRGANSDVNGWLRYTDVRPEEGATVRLNQRNDSNLVVDFNLIAGSAKVRNNDSDSRVYIGNVAGDVALTGLEELIIAGDNHSRLIGALTDARLTINLENTVKRVYMQGRETQLGPGNAFTMNADAVVDLVAAQRLEIYTDPGGGTINSMTPGGPPIRVYLGRDGATGLSDALTINLSSGNLLRGYVREVGYGTPQIINHINANVVVTGTAEIEAERDNDSAWDGFAYFHNVHLTSGAALNLDRANGSTVADIDFEDVATVSNIGTGTTIFVGDVTGTATDAALTVGGSNNINVVGTLTDAALDITNTGTTYLLDMTTTSLGKKFDLNHEEVFLHAGTTQVGGTKGGWTSVAPPNLNLDPGVGTMNAFGGNLDIVSGRDGAAGVTGATAVNISFGSRVRGAVVQAPSEVVQGLDAAVSVADDGTPATDAILSTRRSPNDPVTGDTPGRTDFTDLTLGDASLTELQAEDSTRLFLPTVQLAGDAQLVNNTSISRIFIGDVPDGGAGHTLTLGGSEPIHLVGNAATPLRFNGWGVIEETATVGSTIDVDDGGVAVIRKSGMTGNNTAVHAGGVLAVNDATFTQGAVTMDTGGAVALAADIPWDDDNANATGIIIAMEGYSQTLTIDNNLTQIGASWTDRATLTTPLAGTATAVNFGGGDEVLGVGAGVIPAGATALTITQDVRIDGAQAHTGANTIGDGTTANTVYAMDAGALGGGGGGGVGISQDATLRVLADGFASGAIDVNGAPDIDPLQPYHYGTLDLRAATVNSAVNLSGGRIAVQGATTVTGAVTEDADMTFNGGGSVTFSNAAAVALAADRTWTLDDDTAVAFAGQVASAAPGTPVILTKAGNGVLRLDGGVSNDVNLNLGASPGNVTVIGPAGSVNANPNSVVINANAAYSVEQVDHAYGEVDMLTSSGCIALGADAGAAVTLTMQNNLVTLGAFNDATFSGTLVPDVASDTYVLGGGGGTLTVAGGVLTETFLGFGTNVQIGRMTPAPDDITHAGMVQVNGVQTATGDVDIYGAAGIEDENTFGSALNLRVNAGGSLDLGNANVATLAITNLVMNGGGIARNGGPALTLLEMIDLFPAGGYIIGGGGAASDGNETKVADGALDIPASTFVKVGSNQVRLVTPGGPSLNLYADETRVEDGRLVVGDVTSLGQTTTLRAQGDSVVEFEAGGTLPGVSGTAIALEGTSRLEIASGQTLVGASLSIADGVSIEGDLDVGAAVVGGAGTAALNGSLSAAYGNTSARFAVSEGSALAFPTASDGSGIGSLMPNSTLSFGDADPLASAVSANVGGGAALTFTVDPDAGPAGWTDGAGRVYTVNVDSPAGGATSQINITSGGGIYSASYGDVGITYRPVAHIQKTGDGTLTTAGGTFDWGNTSTTRKLAWDIVGGTLGATAGDGQGLGPDAYAWVMNDKRPTIANQHLESIDVRGGATLAWGGTHGFLEASTYGGLPAGEGDGFNAGEFRMYNGSTLQGSNLDLGFYQAYNQPGTGTPTTDTYLCYPTIVTASPTDVTFTGSTNFNSGIELSGPGPLNVTANGAINFTGNLAGAQSVDVIDTLTVTGGTTGIYKDHTNMTATDIQGGGSMRFDPGAGNAIAYNGTVNSFGTVRAASGTTTMTAVIQSPPAPPGPPPAPTEGLLAQWLFDESPGAMQAADASGNGHNLDLFGNATFALSKPDMGNALVLDGDIGTFAQDTAFAAGTGTDYIDGLSAFTVAMWIKSDQIATDRGFFITHDATGQDRFLTMRYDNAGANGHADDVIKAGVSSTADNEFQLETVGGVQTTDWQHVAMMWTSTDVGGDGFLHFFIDGAEDAYSWTEPAATGGTVMNCTTVIVGKGGKDRAQDTNGAWDGMIDAAYVYNRALASDELQRVMIAGPVHPPKILVEDAAKLVVGGFINQGNVEVRGSGVLQTGSATSSTYGLVLEPGATLDLTDGNLVVDYPDGGPSVFDDVVARVTEGYNDILTPWTGTGITSSTARDHVQRLTGLGVLDNSDPNIKLGGLTDLEGLPVDLSSVLVKYTWNGDANLDGVVNSNDYDLIDNAWLLWTTSGIVPDGGFRWGVGDFTYDGDINSNDYDKIDNAFLLQSGTLGGNSGVAPVPEPATLLLLGLGAAAALARKRRSL